MEFGYRSSKPADEGPYKRKFATSVKKDASQGYQESQGIEKKKRLKRESSDRISCEHDGADAKGICHSTTTNCQHSYAQNLSEFLSFHSLDSLPATYKTASSRCGNEFENMKIIGIGGFGRVFHATHKIDGCWYAIKKIKLGKKIVNEALREVKILARLNHPNIVAYKTSWIEISHEDSFSSSEEAFTISDTGEVSPSYSVINSNHMIDGDKADCGSNALIKENDGIAGKTSNKTLSMRQKKHSKHANLREKMKMKGYDTNESSHGEWQTCEENFIPYNQELGHNSTNIIGCGKSPHRRMISSSAEPNLACFSKGVKLHSTPVSPLGYVLHIQMQYYKETLQEWIDKRNIAFYSKYDGESKATLNKINQSENKELSSELEDSHVTESLYAFLCILKGVKYIHTMGVIHHDLKPGNIFVETVNYDMGCCRYYKHRINKIHKKGCAMQHENCGHGYQMRIGDFGLACWKDWPKAVIDRGCTVCNESLLCGDILPTDFPNCCTVEARGVAQRDMIRKERSMEILGTRVYAAPEQLQGQCHPKSDLYSLGIILFEMLVPFKTYMERADILSSLRINGNVTPDFEKRYPSLAGVIKNLLMSDPERRLPLKILKKKIQLIIMNQKY